jgi:hypothetical protein
MTVNDDDVDDDVPLPRIDSAEALDGRKVKVTWRDGMSQVVDISPALASRRIFLQLRTDDELFRTLQVNEDGNAIEWDDGAELSAMWIERIAPTSLKNDEFRDAMDRLGFTLDGMASRLGLSRRLIASYRKDKPIPETVGLAVRYLVDKDRKAS